MEGSSRNSQEITSSTLDVKFSLMVKETLQGKMVYLSSYSQSLYSPTWLRQSGCFDLVFYDYSISNVFEEGDGCASVDAINITLII